MNKFKYYIIGGICFFAVATGTLAAIFHDPQYPVQITKELKESDKHLEEARGISCIYIASLRLDCAKKNTDACNKLSTARQEYKDNFGTEATECDKDEEAVQQSSSSESSNPLFFGDEAGNK